MVFISQVEVLITSNSKLGCFSFFCALVEQYISKYLAPCQSNILCWNNKSDLPSNITRYNIYQHMLCLLKSLFLFFCTLDFCIILAPPPIKLILKNKPPGAYSIIYGIYNYIIKSYIYLETKCHMNTDRGCTQLYILL